MTSARSHRSHVVAVAAILVLPLGRPSLVTAQSAPAVAPANDREFAAFRTAVDGYVALRTRIRGEVPPLRVTPNAQEIADRSDALARAVTRARRNAAQGQFFDASAAAAIRRILAAALAAGDAESIRAALDDDMTSFDGVRVHARYPVGFVLASTPPTLLHALPPLPQQLEYRFIGRALILRDTEAALIIDYLPDALPAP